MCLTATDPGRKKRRLDENEEEADENEEEAYLDFDDRDSDLETGS